MAHIEVSQLGYRIPGGRTLFEDVSFAVRDGQHVGMVGPNGVGKTTLLRVLAGELRASSGTATVQGDAGYMPQLVGERGNALDVRGLLLSVSRRSLRESAAALAEAEAAVRHAHGRAADLRYTHALTAWGDAGGYEAEVLWDICTQHAVGLPFDEIAARPVSTFSGGEQKRLVLEALFRSKRDVLLLDEPDNFLDVEGKEWLERTIARSDKTILFVSHDRELLARAPTRIVTVEAHGAWVHEDPFTTWPQARATRVGRIEELHRRHVEHRARLVAVIKRLQLAKSPKTKAYQTRLARWDAQMPPERVREQRVRVDLSGGRTGRRAVAVRELSVPGVFDAFDAEIEFGDRVAVVGPNGTGKTHFLRVLSGEDAGQSGQAVLGSRVAPGVFSQTHDHEETAGRWVRDILTSRGLDRGDAMRRLRRYELQECLNQPFETLSGGQQARLQILLLELSGATLLLLDEPTDNLDVASAEALEDALAEFEGTVIAVTHDRWFMRGFDRFLVFAEDGRVRETLDLVHA